MYSFVLCLIGYCGTYNEFVKQKAGVTCFNILANWFSACTSEIIVVYPFAFYIQSY